MRVTNNMLINNSLANINSNKTRMDNLNTQLASQKKIQRPSDDPIIAIRALRFRSSLNEISQYLDKNIPDAHSWLKVTEDALQNVSDLLKDIVYYSNQGANDTLEASDRRNIVNNLAAYRDQIYLEGNADYAGRTIFTGYKTDKMMTFSNDEANTKYSIVEVFNKQSFDMIRKVSGGVNVNPINMVSSSEMPSVQNLNRIRLSYDNLDIPSDNISLVYGHDNTVNPPIPLTREITTASLSNAEINAYQPGDDAIYFIPETGELIFGKNAFEEFKNSDFLSITYEKTGFSKGDLIPEHFFTCSNITDSENPLHYNTKSQAIEYTINFNQKLKVNTEARDVFHPSMTRDIDEMINAVTYVLEIEEKLGELMNKLSVTNDGETKKKLESMIEATKREYAFAEDNMQKIFGNGITKFTQHQQRVDLAIADVGSRIVRLELSEARLKDQRLTFEDLKSINEDVDISEVAIKFMAAQSVYDASLAAASKVVQRSLLDFIK